MENQEPPAPVVVHFSEIEDPHRYNRRHYLRDILVIAICAAIAGANSWKDVAQFGELKVTWLKDAICLELPHGVPSGDTFRQVFAALDTEHSQACFVHWIRAVEKVTREQVVAIDSKTLRRSHDRSQAVRGDGYRLKVLTG